MFILGVPKHNPDANVLIRHPKSGFARAGLGVEVVPEELILHLVMLGQEMEMVVLGEPTLPLLER